MSDYKQVAEGKDPVLWDLAQKSVSFKNFAAPYVIVNAFLWAVCYFISNHLIAEINVVCPGLFGLQ